MNRNVQKWKEIQKKERDGNKSSSNPRKKLKKRTKKTPSEMENKLQDSQRRIFSNE